MTIGVIDARSGNITSVGDALARIDRDYRIIETPDQLDGIGQILLPGQGRFGAVMSYLEANGWVPVLKAWAAAGKPLVGICVGMQVFFDSSEEDPGIAGLGLFTGEVKRLHSPKQPMMGWATVHWDRGDYPEGAAYFVNSYVVESHEDRLGHTRYGSRFCAAVARDNITAFQFHPEKSGRWGKELLDKCLIS